MNTNPSQNNQTLKQISSIEECEAQLIENIIESIYLSLFDTKFENLTPDDRELLLQCFSDYESAIKPKLEQYLKQASTVKQLIQLIENKQSNNLIIDPSFEIEKNVNNIAISIITFFSYFKNWATQLNSEDSKLLKVAKLLAGGTLTYFLPKLSEDIKPVIRQSIYQFLKIEPNQPVDFSDFDEERQKIAEEIESLSKKKSLLSQDNKELETQKKVAQKTLFSKNKDLVDIQQQISQKAEELTLYCKDINAKRRKVQKQIEEQKRRCKAAGILALEDKLNLAQEELGKEKRAISNLESSLTPTEDEENEGCAAQLGCLVLVFVIIIFVIISSL